MTCQSRWTRQRNAKIRPKGWHHFQYTPKKNLFKWQMPRTWKEACQCRANDGNSGLLLPLWGPYSAVYFRWYHPLFERTIGRSYGINRGKRWSDGWPEWRRAETMTSMNYLGASEQARQSPSSLIQSQLWTDLNILWNRHPLQLAVTKCQMSMTPAIFDLMRPHEFDAINHSSNFFETPSRHSMAKVTNSDMVTMHSMTGLLQ